MPKFSLKDVLIATTFAGIDLGAIGFGIHYAAPHDFNHMGVQLVLILTGANLTGSGLFYPLTKAKGLWIRVTPPLLFMLAAVTLFMEYTRQ